MQKKLLGVFLVVAALSIPVSSFAGPCAAIEAACKSAGFIPGDWKKGDGLWRDCIDPIMQGQTTVPGGTKPLPQVSPQEVAMCKAKHPRFGGGKVGSVQ